MGLCSYNVTKEVCHVTREVCHMTCHGATIFTSVWHCEWLISVLNKLQIHVCGCYNAWWFCVCAIKSYHLSLDQETSTTHVTALVVYPSRSIAMETIQLLTSQTVQKMCW